MSALAAGYFTFLISVRSLLCSLSFCCSSLDMLPAELGAASSLFAVFAFVAANAVREARNCQPQRQRHRSIPCSTCASISSSSGDLVQARSRSQGCQADRPRNQTRGNCGCRRRYAAVTAARGAGQKRRRGPVFPAGTTVAKPGRRCDGGRGGDCCIVAGVAGRRSAARAGERRSVEGPVRQGAPRAGTGAGAVAARRARPARRRACGVGRRTVRLRRRRAREGAPLRAPHPRSRGALPARRGAVCARPRRGGAAGAPHRELEIGKTPTARMEKLWLARIYARRGYVVLADRLYESMQPPPPAADAEVSLNQADAHLINEDWMGGARVLQALPGARAQERARPRDARVGAGGGRRPRRRAAGAAQLSDDCADDVARSRLRARARTRREFPAARDRYKRALAQEAQPDATLRTSYQRMRFRTTPELAGGASLRSDPQAWAWRVQAGAALPFGMRHSVAAYAWHDSFVRLEREPGRRARTCSREARHRHRSRRARGAGPSIGRVAAVSAPTRATRRRRAPTRPGPTLLAPRRRLSRSAPRRKAPPICGRSCT